MASSKMASSKKGSSTQQTAEAATPNTPIAQPRTPSTNLIDWRELLTRKSEPRENPFRRGRIWA
ncbi:MAG: hypothetical protein MJA27_16210 [Pseudanabaenales cyanobacterium]|nr:hypothetical protein [Pseudanabaenales cyanobacterium]